MSIVVVNSDGQMTIPPALRQKLGIAHGGKLELVELGAGVCGLIATTEDIRSLKGIVRKPSQPVTLEDMEQAIRKRAVNLGCSHTVTFDKAASRLPGMQKLK